VLKSWSHCAWSDSQNIMRQWNNCQNSSLWDSENKHESYCWSFKDSMWVAKNAQSTSMRIKE